MSSDRPSQDPGRRAPATGPASAAPSAVAKRGGLATRVPALRPDPTLFQRIGGRPVIARIVDGLYDGIESDPSLRPLFKSNLMPERQNQKAFFEEWLGGEQRWHRYRGLLSRHSAVDITAARAASWLGHFSRALDGADVGKDLQTELFATLQPIAGAFVNADLPCRLSLACPHTWKSESKLAAAGDLAGVSQLLADSEEFAQPAGIGIQMLLFNAARRGHEDLVQYLLDAGADPNLPDCSITFIPVTAHCIAKTRGHERIAEMLLERGALIDIFSAAYLGDMARLTQILDEDPDLVNVLDPAIDLLDVTPLRHAVEAGETEAVAYLLERGARFSDGGGGLLQKAMENKRAIHLVRVLLSHGADASAIAPGPWVLDAELAAVLFAAKADFSRADGSWIEYCTGHHGNRENPALIQAFIDHGIDVNRRTAKQRSALHCATRVGYVDVMQVLIRGGAEINAQDALGDTPFAYLFQARKNVDIELTARMLLEHGADPKITNGNDVSALELALATRGAAGKTVLKLLRQRGLLSF